MGISSLFGISSKDFYGPTKTFDCPACFSEDVQSMVIGGKLRLMLLYFIPIVTTRYVYVECPECRKRFYLKINPLLVMGASKEFLNQALLYQPSLLGKLLSIFSFLICWIPILSLPFCILSMYLVRGTHGFARVLSIVALAMSLVLSIPYSIYITAS